MMKFEGTITALITPLIDQELDEEGLAMNIHTQIQHGVDGIFLLGSTGESSTLSLEEQKQVIKIGVREAKGKVPIWAGTGSYSTQQAIEKTKTAKDLGADVALIVAPYYNKPTQEGIYRHYEAIATRVEIPIVVYNIPGRCGINIETSTLKRMASLPNIVGIKESPSNINQVGDIIHTVCAEHPHFRVFSGDDILTLPMMALGAAGVVSVVSNLLPARVNAQVQAALQGQLELARKMHHQLLPLYHAAFIETNPVPIKAAMHLCGMPSGGCRLPLCPLAPENLHFLRQLLVRMQLIEA